MIICFGMMLTITFTSKGDDQVDVTSTVEGKEQVMSYSGSQLALGYLLIFICAWTFAINCVMVRALSFLHSSVIMFWHGVIGIVMALGAIAVVALTTEQGFTIFSYDLQTYGLILAATMCDTLALNSQTIAF